MFLLFGQLQIEDGLSIYLLRVYQLQTDNKFNMLNNTHPQIDKFSPSVADQYVPGMRCIPLAL